MKKFLTLFIVIIISLTGCVSRNDYSTLEAKLSEANATINSLQKQINDLTSKIDFYENGAKNQLIAIRNSWEAKDYQKVISLAAKLHSNFNGSAEDIEAQRLSANSQTALKKIEADKKAESERITAEAAKSAQVKARSIIRVKKISFDMDSAGGVNVYITWTNNSDKIIKYATFTVSPYNAVGDEILNHDNYDATSNLESTGPFKKGQGNNASNNYWSLVWYNSTTKTIRLEKVNIEYMDGTSITLTGENLSYVQY